MEPTAFDIKFIELLAPLQTKPLLVDAIEALSETSAVTGLVFAAPLFLYWHLSQGAQRSAAQRLVLTTLLATIIGALASVVAQQAVRWRPPATNPATAAIYAAQFHENPNPNSFPSDSTMLYSTVAFGVMTWNRIAGVSLLAWLLVFVAPTRIFTGGHYPMDIAAGLLLGLLAYRLSRYLTRNSKVVEALSHNFSPLVVMLLFAWLFEVGKGFADVRQVANTLWHIRRHL